VIALLAGVALAAEYASTPQPVVFADTSDAFSVIAFDTGYLPSISDPVSVRFHITPSGGVTTVMDATSHLEWPELTHELVGEAGTGELAIDSHVEIEAEVYINLPPLYSGSIPLWAESVSLFAITEFDPLLLGAESPAEVRLDGVGLIDPLALEINIIFGLDLVFAADFYPTIEATLAGRSVDSTSPHAAWSQVADGEGVELPLPGDHDGTLPMELTYIADLGTLFSFVIEPSASLDTLIGDFDLIRFPIDVPLVDAGEERAYPTVAVEHPLPALGELPDAIDFGSIEVGRLVNANVGFPNLGVLGLQGTAQIDGDGSFAVWPEDLYALEGQTDGVVVTFLPGSAGDRRAELVLSSNDPGVPEWRVALTGAGLAPEVSTPPGSTGTGGTPDGGGDPVPEATVEPVAPTRECACASGGGFTGVWPMLGLVAFLRRRSRT
jgi:hypothetical protein